MLDDVYSITSHAAPVWFIEFFTRIKEATAAVAPALEAFVPFAPLHRDEVVLDLWAEKQSG